MSEKEPQVRKLRKKAEDITPDRVWISIDRRVYLGKQESLNVSCGASVSLIPGEKVAAAMKRIGLTVRAEHAELLEVVREEQTI